MEVVLKGEEEAGGEHGASFGLLLICLGRMTLRMVFLFFAPHKVNQAVGQNNTKFGLWLYWYAVNMEVDSLFS